MRSRVTPGMSWTMLIRFPTRALSRLDLPTLGRPTIAMTGSLEGAWGIGPILRALFWILDFGLRIAGSAQSKIRNPKSKIARLSGLWDNFHDVAKGRRLLVASRRSL